MRVRGAGGSHPLACVAPKSASWHEIRATKLRPLAEKCACVCYCGRGCTFLIFQWGLLHIASMSTPPGPTDPTIVFLVVDLPICRVVWGPAETWS